MEYINDYSDERLKGWCVHCGKSLPSVESNRDHVPSKSLLEKPYPKELPVIEVCKTCNEGFSKDEEYLIALLGAVLSGSTNPEDQALEASKRIFSRNPKLAARIERKKKDNMINGETITTWEPERDRVNQVILKNARGHFFYEIGEAPQNKPDHIWCDPLDSLTYSQSVAFEQMQSGSLGGWPEVGSRMMERLVTGKDMVNGWIVVQESVYRYKVEQGERMIVRSILYEYLGTEVVWTDCPPV